MELRPELMPPTLDEALVTRLAKLAARLDGAQRGQWEDDLAEFNRLAGTNIPVEEFQGVSGGQSHEDYVRRVLYRRMVRPDPALSRVEMAEVVARIRTGGRHHDFYLAIFRANCRHPSRTDLIYWPDSVPELPRGREPTAEEIAELAMR